MFFKRFGALWKSIVSCLFTNPSCHSEQGWKLWFSFFFLLLRNKDFLIFWHKSKKGLEWEDSKLGTVSFFFPLKFIWFWTNAKKILSICSFVNETQLIGRPTRFVLVIIATKGRFCSDSSVAGAANEGVLANFFNSLLSKKTGTPGSPGTGAVGPGVQGSAKKTGITSNIRVHCFFCFVFSVLNFLSNRIADVL